MTKVMAISVHKKKLHGINVFRVLQTKSVLNRKGHPGTIMQMC